MTDRHPGAPVADPFVCIVTGAGSGIGREIAVQLAEKGASLTLVGRRPDPLVETAARCAATGAATLVIAEDVGDLDGAAERIVAATLARFGRIDGLVNDAATASMGPFEGISAEDTARMFTVNVIGPLMLIRAAAPELARVSGSVVNVTSGAGINAAPRAVAYGASKAALNHATRSLARELGPAIRVNAVSPGTCRTEIWERTGLTREQIDARLIELGAMVPAGRVGEPGEVARWVCHLLDRQSGWVTGSIIPVDGGFTA